jgi:hypothetical protein
MKRLRPEVPCCEETVVSSSRSARLVQGTQNRRNRPCRDARTRNCSRAQKGIPPAWAGSPHSQRPCRRRSPSTCYPSHRTASRALVDKCLPKPVEGQTCTRPPAARLCGRLHSCAPRDKSTRLVFEKLVWCYVTRCSYYRRGKGKGYPLQTGPLAVRLANADVLVDAELLDLFRGFHARRKSEFVTESDQEPNHAADYGNYRCHREFREAD